MDWIFHIVALVCLAVSAVYWNNGGGANQLIKTGMALAAAFAAVMVATDWVSP
ncbi:hypothetical protein HME9302_00941 [Alteripontixanthobacter maritimus]|uniref:Uncharacterized protein n=2 Tax=Alteripontixanthobacter maritimus TaxID=2161824 RepID=A0A369Q995_9SPHN|nr:hypothetical protein HME9302_00941 [Alteripontixanthobacter maritimus]